MRLLTFRLSGNFAAFRDPSVTSNQTVYYIPSKSALIGLIGAVLGIERSNSLDEIYGLQYLDLFSVTHIGIKFESIPKKVILYTNHRSLKEAKTKPFKTELLESPKYTIFIQTANNYFDDLQASIKNNDFVYTPYLGHAYCPAIINNLQIYNDVEEIMEPENKKTSCVILDESETNNDEFELTPTEDDAKIIIERHLHHSIKDKKLERKVLKHWIPIKSSFRVEIDSVRKLSSFIKMDDDEIVCLY
ncbi:MAG: CRISPR-associated protein Cas5 [Nitrososphaeraceae archaeon]